MRCISSFLVAVLAVTVSAAASAAVSPEQAAELGNSLTAVGAERAGNSEGSIPEYSGGLTNIPAGFKTGDVFRPDPFPDEQPRLVITAQNMAEHAERLTMTTQELLKRYPSYRLDVYPTHRTVVLPQRLLNNTRLNATNAQSTANGLSLEGALPGVPFPIPQTGSEAMWNHLLNYQGHAFFTKYDSWNVDASGHASLAIISEGNIEYPLYDPARTDTISEDDVYFKVKYSYKGPARRAGEAILLVDSVNPLKQPRQAWQYLPGQRRVKLAPQLAYDTPNPGTAGSSTYDDAFIFNGGMDRFDFTLIGKQEMYIPYNAYKLNNHEQTADILTPGHLNPDFVRWELHRVWVVEATLKPGKRHVYSKRRFYLDEDSWIAVASDQYDGRDQLYRGAFAHMTYSYDVQAPNANNQMFYDFTSGNYNIIGLYGPYGGIRYTEPLSRVQWSPESLAGSGIR